MTVTDKEGKQMILVTVENYNSNPTIATERPALDVAMILVKAQVQKIIDAESKQGVPTSGATTDKGNKFTLVVKAVFRICGAASGYASSTGDDILKAKVNFTLPQIESKHYNGIGAFSDAVILVVTPIISSLAPFGALPAQLADAVSKLAAFRLAESSTAAAADAKEVQTALIHPFVQEAKRLLKESCDPIAATLMEEETEWFNLWEAGRKIDHFPHGTTVAEGFLRAPDGIGIYNANVFFPEHNLNVKTLLDGSYRYPKFPQGVTTAVATHPLYKTNTSAAYQVKQGTTAHHDFAMELL